MTSNLETRDELFIKEQDYLKTTSRVSVSKDDLYVLSMLRYETTAAALNFTTYLLAKHPDVQTRLQQEIDHKFGKHTR